MKVQIYSLDDGSGLNTTLRVFKHHFRDMFESRPYCDIDTDDFIECCNNPDKAVERIEKSEIVFNVNATLLNEKAIKIFPNY